MLLSDLLKFESDRLLALKYQIGSLREGIIFFSISEINQLRVEEEEYSEDKKLILAEMEGLAVGVIAICNSSPGAAVEDLKLQLSDCLLKVQSLKRNLAHVYLQIPRLYFPKTPGLRLIKTMLQRLKQVFTCATYQIEEIHQDLKFIVSQRGYIFAGEIVNRKCINIRAHLVDTTYQLQHVIDAMELTSGPSAQLLLWLYHQSEEIKFVKDQLLMIDYAVDKTVSTSEMIDYDVAKTVSTSDLDARAQTDRISRLRILVLQNSTLSTMHYTVDVDRAEEAITEHLLRGTRQLEVVSVTGISGDGKTLLAQNLYKSPNIVDHFNVCVWCAVSQGIRIRELLVGMLIDMKEIVTDLSDEDLLVRLYIALEGRRYLIVIDDVSTAAWNNLRSSFPDDSNGSRILLTSHLSDHTEPMFSDQITLVDNEDITPTHTDEQNREIYRQLPDHLKECFLYFGLFPKDEEISVRNLIWLWIAEGFVEDEAGRSLEDICEEYLMYLIGKNFVIAAKRGYNGKVKKCCVDGQLHDFCLSTAKEDKFLQLITGETHSCSSYGTQYDSYRLSVCGDPRKFIASKPSGPSVRSLLFFVQNEMYAGCHNDVSFIIRNFKFLKVLKLESINVGNKLENGVALLSCLRYMAVGGDMDSLPSSFSKLKYLETLVVKGLENKFFLPRTIWSMTKLRHVRVTNHCIFTLEDEKAESDAKLVSLVSLSMPSFLYGVKTNDILSRLPNLRKLKCILVQPKVGSKQACCLPNMISLCYLESLKLSHSGRPLKNVEWKFPSSLKELTLSKFCLPWYQISAIGRLPNLEALKLISRAFEGPTWEMKDGEFPSLRYLKLESLDIVYWDATRDQLPWLAQLVLRDCKLLEKVPSCFESCVRMI